MASTSAAPSWSFARPSRNSWPTRCGWLMEASTRSGHAAVAVGVGEGVPVTAAVGAAVWDGVSVGVALACGAQAPAARPTASASAVGRRNGVNIARFEDTGGNDEHRDDDLRAPHVGEGAQSEYAARLRGMPQDRRRVGPPAALPRMRTRRLL